jgi:hypothetical protein
MTRRLIADFLAWLWPRRAREPKTVLELGRAIKEMGR